MRSLHKDHIIDLFCFVDGIIPRLAVKRGRPPVLTDSEVITVLLWNTLALRQKTLKGVYEAIELSHYRDFPELPTYQNFVAHCHRLIPACFELLSFLLADTAELRLLDSTMLQVCKLHRANDHKVARNIAAFGKNWQGWHFGFKLHASIDPVGRLAQVVFTPANVHDAQAMPKILNKHCRVACGDTLYGARVMGERIWKEYGTIIIAPPHPKQRRKVAAPWQIALLAFRSKIESVFDYLKEHLNLVSSFPRSVNGYLLHYVRVLLGYQLLVG